MDSGYLLWIGQLVLIIAVVAAIVWWIYKRTRK